MKRRTYGQYIAYALTLGDFVVINAVFYLVSLCNPNVEELHSRLVWLLLNVAYLPVARLFSGTHKIRAVQMDRIMARSLQAVGCHLLLFVSLLYFMNVEAIGWKILAEFYLLFSILLMLWWTAARFCVKSYRIHGGNFVRVVVVGCRTTGIRVYNEMCSDEGFGYRCQGFFDIYCPPDFPYKHLYRGTLDDLAKFVEKNRTEELFYTLSGEDKEAVQLTLGLCDSSMIKFHYVPPVSPHLTRNFKLSSLGPLPVLEVNSTPLELPLNAALKRAFDITVSSLFMVVSPLIFLPVSIAIKLSSPGPVMFCQRRTGYKGREFTCFKFRTMVENEDADLSQAGRNDSRVTKVGRWLRRTSVDELPQFINVLRGDMSVVGPRPHMLKHTKDYSAIIDEYMVRHLIKPGITGWAQVRGLRGGTDELWQMEKRVEHDIWYIEHWSLLLDVKIIIRTVINLFRKDENAF